MEKKTLKEVSSSLRSVYQKAQDAQNKSNPDYAIELYKTVLAKEPCFVEAREKLRLLEKKKKSAGPFKKLINSFMSKKKLTSGQIAISRKKYLDAMNAAEEILAIDITDLPALKLLAQAAEGYDARFIAIEAMETALEYYANEPNVLKYLADLYTADKQGVNALRIRQKILSLNPEDLNAQQAVRSAAALATMEENQWGEENRSARDMLKDAGQAKALEQKDRIARNIDDVNDLIIQFEKQKQEQGDSVEVCRRLADLYQKADRHDDAIEMFNKISDMIGTVDPTIDRGIEKSHIAKFDKSIAEWQAYAAANPDKQQEAEANIAKINQDCFQYRKEKALERVNNYPNDLQLRYELALVFWEAQDIDQAIEQFQLAQRNPQRRLSALVYLGRCFNAKGHFDIAVEQFQKSISEMFSMDKQKMEALYNLGITFEGMGQPDKACDCYKQIYQSDSKYLDVEERMQKTKPK